MGRESSTRLLAAFEGQYSELLRFLVRRTGDPQRAEDVAQEAWLKVAGGVPEAAVRNPRAYLFRVAANLATDRQRQERRHAQRRAEEAAAHALPDPLACPERRNAARERLAALDEALASLPDNTRRALLMSRVEGIGFAGIAAELGVSESMVAKYIAQALRACRAHLERLDAGP